MADVETWALVLAAGEDSRLRSLTTKPCGTAVPNSSAHSMASARCWRMRLCVRARAPSLSGGALPRKADPCGTRREFTLDARAPL